MSLTQHIFISIPSDARRARKKIQHVRRSKEEKKDSLDFQRRKEKEKEGACMLVEAKKKKQERTKKQWQQEQKSEYKKWRRFYKMCQRLICNLERAIPSPRR